MAKRALCRRTEAPLVGKGRFKRNYSHIFQIHNINIKHSQVSKYTASISKFTSFQLCVVVVVTVAERTLPPDLAFLPLSTSPWVCGGGGERKGWRRQWPASSTPPPPPLPSSPARSEGGGGPSPPPSLPFSPSTRFHGGEEEEEEGRRHRLLLLLPSSSTPSLVPSSLLARSEGGEGAKGRVAATATARPCR